MYTYTIFDADPNSSGDVNWPLHTGVGVETRNLNHARHAAMEAVYAWGELGQTYWFNIWNSEGVLVETTEMTV
jgi:hypothetical protein